MLSIFTNDVYSRIWSAAFINRLKHQIQKNSSGVIEPNMVNNIYPLHHDNNGQKNSMAF